MPARELESSRAIVMIAIPTSDGMRGMSCLRPRTMPIPAKKPRFA